MVNKFGIAIYYQFASDTVFYMRSTNILYTALNSGQRVRDLNSLVKLRGIIIKGVSASRISSLTL